jgi:flagellar biosynthesis/type III secretory pathway protein FliH
MESRVVKMTDELQKKGADYKKLEDQHFKNVNLMKEAEEQAKAEVENREKIEVELTKLKEKVRKLESECIASIGKAREEGKEEGKAEGKVLGHEAAMDEARTQFRMVYNSSFRQGWKSALKKTEQPELSELFLRSNTPIPYPKEGLKDSDDEAQEEEEEEEDDGEGEEEIRPDSIQEDS